MFSKIVKIMLPVLVLILLLTVLCSCGNKETANTDGKPTNESVESIVTTDATKTSTVENYRLINDKYESEETRLYWKNFINSLEDYQKNVFAKDEHCYCVPMEYSLVANFHLIDESKLSDDFVLENPLDLGSGHENCVCEKDALSYYYHALDEHKVFYEYFSAMKMFVKKHEHGALTIEDWKHIKKIGWLAECVMGNEDAFSYGHTTYYSCLNLAREYDIVIKDGKADDAVLKCVKDEIVLLEQFEADPINYNGPDFEKR